MVVALFALSLAMIVGGLFAVVLGWDIVLLERGWTMVIAGSVSAGSGAVLLGLAVAASRLGRIRKELAELRDTLRAGAMPTPPMLDPVAAVSSGMLAGGALGAAPAAVEAEGQPELPLFMRPEATSREEPSSDVAPGEAPRINLPEDLFGARRRPGAEDEASSHAGDDRPADRWDADDRFGAAPTGDLDDDRSADHADDDGRPSLRPFQTGQREGFLSLDRPAPPEMSVELDRDGHEDRGRGEGAGLSDDDEPRVVPLWDAGDRPAPRETSVLPDPDDDLPAVPPRVPPIDLAPEPAPQPLQAEADPVEAEALEEERHDDELPAGQPAAIIGTYNSGDNRYVMFSDGSIEAETPEGLFRFASLDELKEFIAAGGESRGA
ncbi:MAG TPA: hypothetical protein VIL09_11625 [Microvirga sp.]|jgi:hypothetical protein